MHRGIGFPWLPVDPLKSCPAALASSSGSKAPARSLARAAASAAPTHLGNRAAPGSRAVAASATLTTGSS